MKPIIQSLLDADFYKFTMGQVAFKRHPNVPVKYGFTNRTIKVPLAEFIREDDLRFQLDHVRKLRFKSTELHYLRGTDEYGDRMFCEPYLDFLEGLSLPDYNLQYQGDQFELTFSGRWSEAIYWETIALSIINELYFRALLKRMSEFEREAVHAQGVLRLQEKITKLRGLDLTLSEFGTRRRYSRKWQAYVSRVLATEIPKQFRGTSNTLLAMLLSLMPMGTSAHEMYMVYSGIFHGSDDEIRNSHNKVLRDWWEEYDYALSIALTDTYGSEFFFRDFTREQALNWKGFRQDSGDPFEFGERALAFYKNFDIDPMLKNWEKMIVFSDGLDTDTIIRLYERFHGRIHVSFGWGTNLTNDLGFKPLSLVIKAIKANGHGTVKLSDNMAKAMGEPGEIERFKYIFNHTNTSSQVCLV